MGRSPCCEKVGLRKGTWTAEEDQKLVSYIQHHGHGSWRSLPDKADLQRCGKSCRLRWTNYLRPDIKRGKFTMQEEQTIIQLHALLGNRWSTIANHLPKRTDNEIKNYWNTHLKKRLSKMGIDPSTHKPKMNPLDCSGQPKDSANLNHKAQWECARLEAESRLARQSKLANNIMSFSVSPIQSMPPCLDVLKAWRLGSETWKNINNGFFNPGGTLESPTSTFNFFDNILTGSTTTAISTTTFAPATPVDKNNGMPFLAEMITRGCTDGPNIIINDDDAIDYAAYFEESLIRPPNFSDGFDDVKDSDNVPFDDGTGDLEDNRRYWNNTVNVENPTSTSQI